MKKHYFVQIMIDNMRKNPIDYFWNKSLKLNDQKIELYYENRRAESRRIFVKEKRAKRLFEYFKNQVNMFGDI